MNARYPALGFPLYRRYWLGSLASVGGWQISAIALGWLVFELTGSAFALGVLGAAMAVPAIVLTIAGGVIADRFDKHRVLLVTTLLNAIVLLLLAVLCALDRVNVWVLWLAGAAISAISGIDWPARQSFFPHLIERSALVSAVALNSVLWQVTRMVLPAVGGALLEWFAAWVVFALAGLGYLCMLAVLTSINISIPGTRGESPIAQTLTGLRFIVAQPLFRGMILLSWMLMMLVSSYMQLMPAFAALLDSGPQAFGLLMSATGVGSLAGTALAGGLQIGSRYGYVVLGAAAASALVLFGFAASVALPNYALALFFVLLAGAGMSVFLVLSTTSLQAAVPDELRGRVMGVHGITYSVMPLGGLLMGGLAEPLGAPGALVSCLVLFLFVLAVQTASNATLRTLQAPAS